MKKRRPLRGAKTKREIQIKTEDAIQQAAEHGNYLVAIFYCNGTQVNSSIHWGGENGFPEAVFGECVHLLNDALYERLMESHRPLLPNEEGLEGLDPRKVVH